MDGSRKSVHAAENKTRHRIIIGDARKMAELADESVHLVVTSPPYWQLKDYGNGRLIGLVEKRERREEALQLLERIAVGQKAFLRFDAVTHDKDDMLLCYLYLQNRTFLNAQLVRRGLVAVDEQVAFRYKPRFLEIAKGNHG